MSRIPESTVNLIFERTDIVAVIGEYVRLEKKGGRYVGLCPFHNEKTPSFSVDREKGFFYCFGCQKGGNAASFLMEQEKLTYREALEELAKKAGVPVEIEEAPSGEDQNRHALLELNERLAKAFNFLLASHESGANARAYLARRGVPDQVREEFRLGYAPADRNWLHSFLTGKGYSPAFLAKSGLFSERRATFPLFADRLMFPIASPRGETIAFGGRLLEGDGPKYINSPDTILFHKQENLFALDKAIPAIKKEGCALVCEGYMDALSFHIAGLSFAVAPLGTAFTERQAHLLRRWSDKVFFAFDADAAGQKAAEKACVLAAAAGLDAKVVVLPGGKDASEILEKEGPGSLQKVRELAINGDEFLLRRARLGFDVGSMEGKAKAAAFLHPYIAALDSEVKRDALFERVAHELRVDARSLRSDYEDAKRGLPVRRQERPAGERESPLQRTPDYVFMVAVAANLELFKDVRKAITIEDLDDRRAKDLFIALEEGYRAEDIRLESVLARLSDEQLRNSVLAAAASGEFDQNADRFVEEGILRIKRRSLALRHEKIRERIAELGTTGEGLSELQYELMHIDAELAKMKGERDERS
jgi:DNA primase